MSWDQDLCLPSEADLVFMRDARKNGWFQPCVDPAAARRRGARFGLTAPATLDHRGVAAAFARRAREEGWPSNHVAAATSAVAFAMETRAPVVEHDGLAS